MVVDICSMVYFIVPVIAIGSVPVTFYFASWCSNKAANFVEDKLLSSSHKNGKAVVESYPFPMPFASGDTPIVTKATTLGNTVCFMTVIAAYAFQRKKSPLIRAIKNMKVGTPLPIAKDKNSKHARGVTEIQTFGHFYSQNGPGTFSMVANLIISATIGGCVAPFADRLSK